MTNEEIEKEVVEILKDQDVFVLKSVTDINHTPHRFMIGSKHVAHAADYHGGRLGEDTLKAVPCAYPGCGTSYEDHTSDKVLFMSLLRDVEQEEARDILTRVIVVGDGVLKGVAFVETPEKYKIKDDGGDSRKRVSDTDQ